MIFELILICVFILALAFMWTRYFDRKNVIVQPRNEIKNLHKFLQSNFGGKILKFNLNTITKPGDNYNSKIRGLQVKLLKSNHSNEVVTYKRNN